LAAGRGPVALSAALLVLASSLAVAPPAGAHPLGNFSVNRYSRIEVARDGVQLRYVLDLAEIPTLQELGRAGGTAGAWNAAVRERVLTAKARELPVGVRLEIDGLPVAWTVRAARLDLLPGQADLETLRIELTLAADVTAGEGARLIYQDTNYSGRAGWHEIVLRAVEGLDLLDSTAPADDASDELRAYPADPAVAPLDRSAATARVTLGAGSPSTQRRDSSGPAAARLGTDAAADHLTAFLRPGADRGLPTLLLAIALAAALGALHGLGPGHGKALVGAYLIGARGTPGQAVLLGLTVTVTHTLGVYALGLVTLVAAQYLLPETVYPVLGVVSGLLVAAIGLVLARARLIALWPHHEPTANAIVQAAAPVPSTLPIRPWLAIDMTEGAVAAENRAADPRARPHRHGLGPVHTHEGPGSSDQPVTFRSLLALGVSGGLLPCPSALVVLLAAIAFHNVALGMALVAAFSVGLAGVLTALGLLVVYSGRWLSRFPLAQRAADSSLARAVPAVSALAITAAGLAIAVQAAHALL
jgi:ABC-type nickel/cobalt efflux system permease component RcnA